MHEIKAQLEHFRQEIDRGIKSLDLDNLRSQKSELMQEMNDPGFWNDPAHAASISQKVDQLQKQVSDWEGISIECNDLLEMLPSIQPENDPAAAEEYREMVQKFIKKWQNLSVQTFLNGKYDHSNAILSIHTGTGGKDAQDFSAILLRMYLRWAEQNSYKAEIIEKTDDEVGIKSASISIKGPLAYGYLKGEAGVHRLIRLSPFNSKNTRETSFSRIEILPEIPPVELEEIPKDDLRIETFRASGAGGQHVNTTDSAVRITHLPTGLVAQCQNERSQIQNKDRAMTILHAKLAKLKEEQQAETINQLKGDNKEMTWGHQIRSYTFHPYSLVKDHRTNYEEKNVEKVVDGDLEGFITAYIEFNKENK
jgi:peptide chain release factor 2